MYHFKKTLLAAGLLLPLFAGPVAAEKLSSVVELFTSQGCSSCPPADAYLRDLNKDDTVLALAYHVDYWDYLGWKDTLAQPENTAFQRKYQKVFKSRSIYTPQMVVNGRAHLVGSDRTAIAAELASQTKKRQNLIVDVSLKSMDDRIQITAPEQDMMGREAVIELVYFSPEADVVVARGENAGKTLRYVNSVMKVDMLGMWSGEAKSLDLPKSQISANKAENCAVIVRQMRDDGLPGAIIGAALLKP